MPTTQTICVKKHTLKTRFTLKVQQQANESANGGNEHFVNKQQEVTRNAIF